MLDQKSSVQKIHRLHGRLRSTATNNIVEENQEVNQDHRGGLNIRGQAEGKELLELEVEVKCLPCQKRLYLL